MADDPATEIILGLDPRRARREALRAHEALMRYGQHDEDCPERTHPESLDSKCDCGFDAACYSPLVAEAEPGK